MTIEEYDSKKEVRETISQIDRCLEDYKRVANKDSLITLMGVGLQLFYSSIGPTTTSVKDKILSNRFKDLLLERKQELLNEFDLPKAEDDDSINVVIDYDFNAYDSDLQHFEMRIPEGFVAEIKGNKVIMKKK